MAITILDELDLTGPVPNFQRDIVNTISEFSSSTMLLKYPDLFEVNCKEDGCRYRLNKKNTVDPTLGKWRKIDPDETNTPSSTLGEDITTDTQIGALASGTTIPSDSTWQDVIKLLAKGSTT